MRIAVFGLLAAATLTGACTAYDTERGLDPRYRTYSSYDYDRPDPSYNGYYANRYYVDNPRYRERRLARNDRVYVGEDGRYYCRRNDGTTGLIVGGIAGGALGAAVTSGRSEILGVLLGAAVGAAAGSAVDRDNVRCR